MPRSVLMSETASAPCGLGGGGDVGRRGAVRRQLHDQRLARERPHARRAAPPSRAGSAPMIIPVSTFGQETLSSSAATSSRSANAATSVADLLAGEAHDVDDQRDRQLGELRQVVRRGSRARPLFGSPIELIMPAGELPQPRRRVALARLERDGLGDEGGEREARRAARRRTRAGRRSRRTCPSALMTGCASWMPQKSIASRATDGSRASVGVEHRAVDAQPHVAVARRHDAAEAGAEPARHARLERELRRHAARGAQRAHRLEHRRRPAGVDLDARRVELRRSRSVTSPWWPTEPSSVATRAPRSSAAPSACSASRKPEQRRGRRAERVLPDRQRRDPDAAADEQRRAARRAARAKPMPERPEQPQPVAGAQLAQPRACPGRRPRAGSRAVPSSWRAQHRERAREERALVRAPAPALGRGEHVELARVRRRAVGVEHGRARRRRRRARARRPRQQAAAERRERAVAHALPPRGAAAPLRVQLLQRDAPAGAPWRAAAIARAAAMPPDDRRDARDAARDRGARGSRSRPCAPRCRSAC